MPDFTGIARRLAAVVTVNLGLVSDANMTAATIVTYKEGLDVAFDINEELNTALNDPTTGYIDTLDA